MGKLGSGSGTVTSIPAGISCGADVRDDLHRAGPTVTLTATAAAGSTFTGWSAPCSGTGTCVITVNSGQTATATFTRTWCNTPCR